MESLEFVIYPDGRIKERVTGVVGRSCEEITAAIEAELGQVVSQEKTSEYFAAEVTSVVETDVDATSQVMISQW